MRRDRSIPAAVAKGFGDAIVEMREKERGVRERAVRSSSSLQVGKIVYGKRYGTVAKNFRFPFFPFFISKYSIISIYHRLWWISLNRSN